MSNLEEIIKNPDGTYTVKGLEEIYLEIIIESLFTDNATAWLGEEIADKAAIYEE